MTSSRPWIVAQVRPQLLRVAIRNMERQGLEVYSPRCRELARGSPRERALFPGYAFARHPEGRWLFLRGTYGVTAVVMGTAGRPAEVPDAEVARLRAREGADGAVDLRPRGLSAGERVRVGGSELSLEGVVEGMTGPDRVAVLMQFLGAQRRVLLPRSDVEPLA